MGKQIPADDPEAQWRRQRGFRWGLVLALLLFCYWAWHMG